MPPAAFSLPSFAKINASLHVLKKRADGFHEICTILQTISLSDTLTFAPSGELTLTCDEPSIPLDGQNLILKGAAALRERFGITAGAAIRLEKHIPSPGGLGGGSSNAAVALIGLSRLWSLNPVLEELQDLGAVLGSDVPFFLSGGTALATGRGEIIEPLADASENFVLIVTPPAEVSTAEAYSAFEAANLTRDDPNRILQICRFEAKSLNLRHSALKNDLEEVVLRTFPEVGRVKAALLELGASAAMMSGSGASVFAVFDKEETRQTALKALDIESTWRKFAVATISRQQYREALQIVY